MSYKQATVNAWFLAPFIKKLTSKREFNWDVGLLQIETALIIRNCGRSYYKLGQVVLLQIGAVILNLCRANASIEIKFIKVFANNGFFESLDTCASD